MYTNEPFSRFYDENLRLLLFGGKGGVGKTTVAAAFSLYISDKYPQKRFLVISTDPAHSLADSFDYHYPLGSEPKSVYGRVNLFGMELDSEKLFSRFREENRQKLKKILSRGTYLDEEDISPLLELSFPGIDELMALIEITKLLDRADYDLIIVDTAPTGHTLRLLDLPNLMQAWVGFLDTLMAKHRYMVRIYSRSRSYKPDEADEFINALFSDIQKIRNILQNKRRCRFVPVTLAEPMVISETHRLLLALAKKGVGVKDILFNQMLIDPGDCELCRATAGMQSFQLEKFRKEWSDLNLNDLNVSLLPACRMEVKGEKRLESFVRAVRAIDASDSWAAPTTELRIGEVAPVTRSARSGKAPLPRPLIYQEKEDDDNIELFFFCGKGGVGKTTLSCAFAIQLSQEFPDKKVLLFSSDPAHSISDCIGERIGSKETQVEIGIGIGSNKNLKNLFAVEIDPESLFKEFRDSYAHQIQESLDKSMARSGMDVQFDQEVITSLLDLAPPGLDEIMALSKLADYIDQDSYDLYVIDAAPTGHALRFLELPGLMREWLRVFFEIILKYKSAFRLPKASEVLVDMSKKVKKVQELLSDPQRCECILVSIPTEMSLKETQRLSFDLKRLKMSFKRIMLNRTLMYADHSEDCDFCNSIASAHEAMSAKFKKVFPNLEMVTIPQWSGTIGAPLSSEQNIEALSKLIVFER